MRLCFDCLLDEDPQWGHRYRMVWLAIFLLGGAAFALPFGPIAIGAQGLFFVAAIFWSVWPLFAARRPIQTIGRDLARAKQQSPSCEQSPF